MTLSFSGMKGSFFQSDYPKKYLLIINEIF